MSQHGIIWCRSTACQDILGSLVQPAAKQLNRARILISDQPLVPNGFSKFRNYGLAPSGSVTPVFFGGTIDLDQAVNRTVSRACELALVSHNKIKTIGQYLRLIRVRKMDSANFRGGRSRRCNRIAADQGPIAAIPNRPNRQRAQWTISLFLIFDMHRARVTRLNHVFPRCHDSKLKRAIKFHIMYLSTLLFDPDARRQKRHAPIPFGPAT